MNFQKINTNFRLKTILAVVFALCIVISSCAVKNSIKHLLSVNNTSHSTSTSSSPKGKFYSISSSLKCSFCKEKEILVKGHDLKDFSLSDVQEFIAFTLIVICGAFLVVKTAKHPFYNSSKIQGTLPIFLQYRKLII